MKKVPTLKDSTYDKLKYVAQVALPALITFYIAVGNLWHLPKIEEVAGTLAALNVALGSLLLLSTSEYNKQAEPPAGGGL